MNKVFLLSLFLTYIIPTFGIRTWAALSCIGGKNVGGYGLLLASAVQAPIHNVAWGRCPYVVANVFDVVRNSET